jgi:hypothetical protein
LVEIKEKFSVRNHTYRATKAGYWKAGTDRPMYYKGDPNSFIAMEKTLAFFQGKEPNGLLTEWVMYEYRLETIMKLKVTLFRLRL